MSRRGRATRRNQANAHRISGTASSPKAMTPTQAYGPDGGGLSMYGGSKFSGALGGYPSTWGIDFEMVRERSRRAYLESPQARALVSRLVDFTIGTGLSYESTPLWELIDGPGEPSDAAVKKRYRTKRDLDVRFAVWAGSHEPDAADVSTLYELQKAEFTDRLVDGETFTVLRYSDDPMRMNPVSIQRYRPEQLATQIDALAIDAARAAGNRIVDGIELDPAGKEVAVWIRPERIMPWDTSYPQGEAIRMPMVSPSGRRFMIHAKLPGHPGQVRGVSVLAPYLHEFKKLDDARIAELEAMVINGLFALWVKPGTAAPNSNIVAGLKAQMMKAGDANPQSGPSVITSRPGIADVRLKADESLESFDTKRPNLNVHEFSRGIAKGIYAGESMPIEMVEIEYNTAYSAARAAILTGWTKIEIYRDMTASGWLGYILEAWFVAEIAAGRIKAKGFGDSPLIRRAWLACMWTGSSMPSIDPQKEAAAVQLRLEMGHTTGQREAMKYNNSDFEENVRVQKGENERLAEARAPMNNSGSGAQLQLPLDNQDSQDTPAPGTGDGKAVALRLTR